MADLKTMSANDAQIYVNQLESDLEKPLTDITGWVFFDVQDYVDELEKELAQRKLEAEYREADE